MAPVPLKEIIIFSSEDSRFPAQNIIKGNKWMTSLKDNSGKAVIEIQLEKASQIHYIDIGYCNVASLGVTVGRSSWPSSRQHVVLLATVILQTPLEARAGKNKTGCRMFNYPEHLNFEYANEKWDRVRINLQQPFVRNKQIGLEFVRIGSARNISGSAQSSSSPAQTAIQGSWKNSAIAKLADANNITSSAMNQLQDKLLRISSTTEEGSSEKSTLSRTAKMVLSSRCGTLNHKRDKLEKIKPTKFVTKTENSARRLGNLTPQPKKTQNTSYLNTEFGSLTPVTTRRARSLGGLCQVPTTNGKLSCSTSRKTNENSRSCPKSPRLLTPNTSLKKTFSKFSPSDSNPTTAKTPDSKNNNFVNSKFGTNTNRNSSFSPQTQKLPRNAVSREVPSTSSSMNGHLNHNPLISESSRINPQKSESSDRNVKTNENTSFSPKTTELSRPTTSKEMHNTFSNIIRTPELGEIDPRKSNSSDSSSMAGSAADDNVLLKGEEILGPNCDSNATTAELPKAEIKRIKRLVQNFFNTFDLEKLDPDKVTLKELRTTFEASHDITLDKDGRRYFRNITVNYLELALTVRQHKQKVSDDAPSSSTNQQTPSIAIQTPTRKRKSKESVTLVHSPIIHEVNSREQGSSPAKIRRVSHETTPRRTIESGGSNAETTSAHCSNQINEVQCPLCMKMFPKSTISTHAALCGEDDLQLIGNDLQTFSNDLQTINDDIEITSVIPAPIQQTFPGETVLDLSDNMRLSEAEKKHWINFTKQPKPYHARMNGELFKNCLLVKCPTCGQLYRSEEIEEHSDECAEKVNSGLEKRGLYYVTKKQKIVNTKR
ncbi:uncharacterized protein LOC120334605 isoform X2 [Styela clava]